MTSVEQIGVRELRQNASVYLRRVQDGETLEITDRGVPIALLSPLPPPRTRLEQLIADGHAQGATCDLLALKRPRTRVPTGWADRELRRQRADRRL